MGDSEPKRVTGPVWALGLGVALALASGCLVHPKTVTSTRTIDRRVVQGEAEPAGPIALSTLSEGRRVVLTTTRPGTCEETTVDTVEITRTRRAAMDGPSGGGELGLAAVIVFLPVTVLSALVTAAVLAGEEPSVSIHERASGSRQVACPTVVRGVALSARLPSGARVDGVSNGRGELVIIVPETEPSRGAVRVWVAGHVEQVRYGSRSLARAP